MDTPKQLLDTRMNVFLAHPRVRDKALRSFGWPGHRAERIVDAHAELLRPIQADPARLGCRHGRVSAWRTPMRRVEPARARARSTGSLGAAKVGEPAHPLGPRSASPRQGLAGGRAPSDPYNGNGAP